MGSSDKHIIWAYEDLDYTIRSEGNIVTLAPLKPLGIDELIGFVLMGIFGLGMCLTALIAGIDELTKTQDNDSICGYADEVQFGDETIYCSDEYSTFSESLSDMEVAEQHFRFSFEYDSEWQEFRWEYMDADEKFVVFGYDYGDFYDCWVYVRSASFDRDWNLDEVGHYWMYNQLPNWCDDRSEASENLTYADGSHPFSGEDLYAVQPEGGMEYISVVRYSTNSIRYVELIHPDSEYFQELSGFETVIPYLIMASIGYYLIRKADGRRPKIVFDTVNKTLTKKHKFHSKPLYLEQVSSKSLNLAIRSHERTTASWGTDDQPTEYRTHMHTGLDLSYLHKGTYAKLAFFDGMEQDSDFAQQLRAALGLLSEDNSSIEVSDKEGVMVEPTVVDDEVEQPKLNAFWES